MHEIVILSGKGGTGKTSLTACFAHLCKRAVICDLDVDAPDLHLLLNPKIKQTEPFYAGAQAVIDPQRCDRCGNCQEICRFGAIFGPKDGRLSVDPILCEGCKACVALCPANAIDFPEKQCGRWHVSDTRFGPMAHAQLTPGEENSGKLVTQLRTISRELATDADCDLIIADGPPGIGCPVISSLGGCQLAVLITEPTPSGLHDLVRIAELCTHFRVPSAVIINKADLNKDMRHQIKAFCEQHAMTVLGALPYDEAFLHAMKAQQTITEYTASPLSREIRAFWQQVEQMVAHDWMGRPKAIA